LKHSNMNSDPKSADEYNDEQDSFSSSGDDN
jgi:hypothetical protein